MQTKIASIGQAVMQATRPRVLLARFHEKVATNNSHIHPKTLPPTSAAAKYHSLRVYFQVNEWKGRGTELNPLDWGWKKSRYWITNANAH